MRAYQFNRVQPHFSHTGGGIWASLGSVFLHCSAFAPLTLHIVTRAGRLADRRASRGASGDGRSCSLGSCHPPGASLDRIKRTGGGGVHAAVRLYDGYSAQSAVVSSASVMPY